MLASFSAVRPEQSSLRTGQGLSAFRMVLASLRSLSEHTFTLLWYRLPCPHPYLFCLTLCSPHSVFLSARCCPRFLPSRYDRVAPTFPRLDGQRFPFPGGPRPRKPGSPSAIAGSARATTSPSIDGPAQTVLGCVENVLVWVEEARLGHS